MADEPRVMWVAEQLAGLSMDDTPTPAVSCPAGGGWHALLPCARLSRVPAQ